MGRPAVAHDPDGARKDAGVGEFGQVDARGDAHAAIVQADHDQALARVEAEQVRNRLDEITRIANPKDGGTGMGIGHVGESRSSGPAGETADRDLWTKPRPVDGQREKRQ